MNLRHRLPRSALVCSATLALCAALVGTPAWAEQSKADKGATDGTHAPTTGHVSYYADSLAGGRTACGGVYEPGALTMAHRTLPCGTQVRVTNLRNRRSVVVEVNDHGPSLKTRVADLSRAAARKLGMIHHGMAHAHLEPIRY